MTGKLIFAVICGVFAAGNALTAGLGRKLPGWAVWMYWGCVAAYWVCNVMGQVC